MHFIGIPYAKVREELQLLPIELAKDLPPEVQTYWRDLRQQAGLPITSEVPPTDERGGSSTQDRLRNHQQDLRSLTEKWISQLKWPESKDLPRDWSDPGLYYEGDFCWRVFSDTMSGGKGLPEPYRVQLCCEVEEDRLFSSLREHLEGDPVWAVYDSSRMKVAGIGMLVD